MQSFGRMSLMVVVALTLATSARTQERATLLLSSGERVSGEVIDVGGADFTVRVSGQERRIPRGQVALIDFVGNAPADADLDERGGPLVVLRNGERFEATLYDIAGTHPLRLTFDTPGGRRELTSNDVARIHLIRSPRPLETRSEEPLPVTRSGEVRPARRRLVNPVTRTVPANAAWTDTGIDVREGDVIHFQADGIVRLSADGTDTAHADGSDKGRRLSEGPLPGESAGALVGRIDNSQPFRIGRDASVPMPEAGRLFLGTNDDHVDDNSGEFIVTFARRVRGGT
jgi:hypothetical protein